MRRREITEEELWGGARALVEVRLVQVRLTLVPRLKQAQGRLRGTNR